MLGHVIPGVEGVYDRHHYLTEKAAALGPALVAPIVSPRDDANVIALYR